MIQFDFDTFVLCLLIAYYVSYFPAKCIIFKRVHFILLDILIPVPVDMLQFELI